MYSNYDPNAAQWQQQQPIQDGGDQMNDGEEDQSHRPPNAFILYSQAMRSEVRQQNPSLSNTEVSRILGKMWKEVPNEVKLQYKQKAAALQSEFKKSHPDYTYRKARRKRALNELLTKSTQGYQPYPGFVDQMPLMAMGQMGMQPQPGQQPLMMGQYPGVMMMNPAQGMVGAGIPGMDQQMQGQIPGMGQQS